VQLRSGRSPSLVISASYANAGGVDGILQRCERVRGQVIVRKLPVATVVSMVCHIVAIGWVVRDGDELAVPPRTAGACQRADAKEHRAVVAVTSDLAGRKAGLFELWDDCAETGGDEVVAGGTAARALVLGVIRGRLRGSDAYTTAELAQLNARRRSTAVFAPYD
jgi:hypothetical protein